MTVVIDTNVLVVANNAADHATPNCTCASIDALLAIRDQEVVVVDESGLIIAEYRRHASPEGQPGVGDEFLKYLIDNRGNEERCKQVRIVPLDGDSFAEFPDDPTLAQFDRDDRKFVAVALSCLPPAEVVNATDTDWRDYRHPLKRHGIKIRFLCPDMMAMKKPSRRSKRGKRKT